MPAEKLVMCKLTVVRQQATETQSQESRTKSQDCVVLISDFLLLSDLLPPTSTDNTQQITDNNKIEPGTRNQEQRLVTANLIFTALF